jgi:hypothetical protein
MSLKATVETVGFDTQVELLRLYPEIANVYYRDAMSSSAMIMQGLLRANVPFGRAIKDVESKISGNGWNLQAEIGWFRGTEFWQVNIFEYGIKKAYEITAHKKELRFFRGAGGYHFAPEVTHPSMPGLHFTEMSWEEAQPEINDIFAVATEGVVNQLQIGPQAGVTR